MGGGVRGSSFSERRNGVEIHFTLISMWLSVLYSLFDISNKWTNSIFSSCKNDFLGIWKAIKHEFCENSWVESLARILAERIICIIKDNCSSGAEWGRCWDSDWEWAVRRHYLQLHNSQLANLAIFVQWVYWVYVFCQNTCPKWAHCAMHEQV